MKRLCNPLIRDLISLLVIGVWLGNFGVLALPNGAPSVACDNMMPSHSGAAEQNSAIPYQLELSSTSITSGDSVTVTLKKSDNGQADFRGFMIQARDQADNVVGSFSTSRLVCISSTRPTHSHCR